MAGEDLKAQIAAAYLNDLLGNYGKTLDASTVLLSLVIKVQPEDLKDLGWMPLSQDKLKDFYTRCEPHVLRSG